MPLAPPHTPLLFCSLCRRTSLLLSGCPGVVCSSSPRVWTGAWLQVGFAVRGRRCSLQVQVAALEALPRVPLHRLGAALAEGELGARILPCLHSSSKEVGFWAQALSILRLSQRQSSVAAASVCHAATARCTLQDCWLAAVWLLVKPDS